MCKPVADKTETAVAYLAARFRFVGFGISLVAFHGVPPQATRLTQTSPVVARTSLLAKSAGISRQIKIVLLGSKIKDGRVSIARPLSKISGGPGVGFTADAGVWTLYSRRGGGENRLR